MNEEARNLLRVLSALLSYPGEADGDSLPDVPPALDRSGPCEEAWEICRGFAERMRSVPLISRMEAYTETFDLAPAGCLDLTRHRWPEERMRRNAVAHLHQVYRQEGYACTARQMPDHLPVLLEFLSVCSEASGRWIAGLYRDAVSALAGNLRERGSPYVCLFEVIIALFDGLQGRERETKWTGT